MTEAWDALITTFTPPAACTQAESDDQVRGVAKKELMVATNTMNRYADRKHENSKERPGVSWLGKERGRAYLL